MVVGAAHPRGAPWLVNLVGDVTSNAHCAAILSGGSGDRAKALHGLNKLQ